MPTDLFHLSTVERTSGTRSQPIYRLDYALEAPVRIKIDRISIPFAFDVIVTGFNDGLVFNEGAADIVAAIPAGSYDNVTFAAAVSAQLTARSLAVGAGFVYTATLPLSGAAFARLRVTTAAPANTWVWVATNAAHTCGIVSGVTANSAALAQVQTGNDMAQLNYPGQLIITSSLASCVSGQKHARGVTNGSMIASDELIRMPFNQATPTQYIQHEDGSQVYTFDFAREMSSGISTITFGLWLCYPNAVIRPCNILADWGLTIRFERP